MVYKDQHPYKHMPGPVRVKIGIHHCPSLPQQKESLAKVSEAKLWRWWERKTFANQHVNDHVSCVPCPKAKIRLCPKYFNWWESGHGNHKGEVWLENEANLGPYELLKSFGCACPNAICNWSVLWKQALARPKYTLIFVWSHDMISVTIITPIYPLKGRSEIIPNLFKTI